MRGSDLRSSMPNRSPSDTAWILRTGVLLTLACAFMAISAWLHRPWWELAFRSDNSPVSWLSAALLVAAALLCVRLVGDGSLPRVRGGILASMLGAMALDEQFMFHERLKYRHLPDGSAFADASTVVLVAGGLLMLWLFLRTVRGLAPRLLMMAAIGVGELALVVDLMGTDAPALLSMLEEGIEVLAETLFVCALLEVRPAAHVQSSS